MSTLDLADARWRKSTRSGTNSNCVEVAAVWRKATHSGSNAAGVEVAPIWRTSSHSGTNASCVEVASESGEVAVRDSKNPNGHVLLLDQADWTALLDNIKTGTFDTA